MLDSVWFVFEIVIIVLAVDFLSGLLHWLEDNYGEPEWPIVGPWIIGPNRLHHKDPFAFTRNSWLRSASALIVIGAVILIVCWYTDTLSWQVLLFVAIGVNANEIHKWSHLPKDKRMTIVLLLQDVGILQSARHHAKHHRAPHDSRYCLVTNALNPILDCIGFWRGLEFVANCLLRVSKASEPSKYDLRHRQEFRSERNSGKM